MWVRRVGTLPLIWPLLLASTLFPNFDHSPRQCPRQCLGNYGKPWQPTRFVSLCVRLCLCLFDQSTKLCGAATVELWLTIPDRSHDVSLATDLIPATPSTLRTKYAPTLMPPVYTFAFLYIHILCVIMCLYTYSCTHIQPERNLFRISIECMWFTHQSVWTH